MNRWMMAALVGLCLQLTACGGTYKYAAFVVIHSLDRLEAGSTVRVVLKDQTTFTGTVVKAEESRLHINLDNGGERTVAWEEIQLLETFEISKAKR